MVKLTNRYADHAPLSIEDAEAARECVDADDRYKDAHNQALDLLESSDMAAANQFQRDRYRKFRQLSFGVVLLLTVVAVLCAVGTMARGDKSNGETAAPASGSMPGDAAFHPPPKFSSVCTKANVGTTQGYDECNDVCTVASCCHDTDPAINCLEEFPQVCEEYEPCKVLLPDGQEWPSVNGKKKTVPLAPSNLAKICPGEGGGEEEDDADRLAQCDMACMEAACCWQDEITNCYASNKEICQGYMPCRDMNGGNNAPNTNGDEHGTPATELPPKSISEQVAEICLDDNVDVSECEEKCAPAACCFLERNHPGSCAASWCEDYAGCKILEHGQDIPHPPDDFPPPPHDDPAHDADVNLVCASDQLSSEDGLEKCKQICKHRECCFLDGDFSCREEDPDWCQGYDVCLPIMKNQPSKEETPPQQGQTVDFECAPDRVSTEMGLEKCREICDKRACCFFKREDACIQDNRVWCSEYEACRPVMEQALKELSSVSLVDFECSPEHLKNQVGLEKCKEICDVSKCCFLDGEGSCLKEKTKWCGEYESCRPVMEKTLKEPPHVSASPVDLDCSPDSVLTEKGLEKCRETCDNRACCFFEGKRNCSKKNPQWCHEYEACRPFVEQALKEPSLVSLVELECSSEHLKTDQGLEKCKDVCDARKCCFLDGEGSCQKEKPKWCLEYEACRPVMDKTLKERPHAAEGTVVAVATTCAPAHVITESGFDQCRELCDVRVCCFLGPKHGCREDNVEWCNEFEACRKVMEEVLAQP